MSADTDTQDVMSTDLPVPPAAPWSVAVPIAIGTALVALTATLVTLTASANLGPGAVAVGAASAITLGALLVRVAARDAASPSSGDDAVVGRRGAAHGGAGRLGPADMVTVGRAVLACAVAALTVELLGGGAGTAAILVVAVPALLLDAVDGWVARRTGTASPLGARIDGEVDAFLILVLGVAVASVLEWSVLGWWVLAAGLARYAFGLAARVLPWMRRPLPYRYWRKVVTAVVGVVLLVALSGFLPPALTSAVVMLALVLLTESFGRDVWWLWRRRHEPLSALGSVAMTEAAPPARMPASDGPGRRRAGPRPGLATVLAVALVWFALLAPTRPDLMTAGAFGRLPVEALGVAAVVLALSARSAPSGRVVAYVAGGWLGVVLLLKLLDLGSFAVLDRPFTLVTDYPLLGAGLDFVGDAAGPWAARGTVVASVLLALAVLVCTPIAVVRLARPLTLRPRAAARVVLGLSVVWALIAALGTQGAGGGSVASADAVRFAADTVVGSVEAVRDQRRFERAIADDPFGEPHPGELSALSGKDVLVVFVESYGRAALEGPDMAPVRQQLDEDTAALNAAGFQARSGFLTSPTFGGSSWLAHAALLSGLWTDDQLRYERVLESSRSTVTSVFGRSGWRTVAVMPSNTEPWPQGQRFYGLDAVYDRSNLGYAGPRFGFSGMPDQFALAAFAGRELAERTRDPVMAQIALTSSHGPWAPLPELVDPAGLGDGTVFESIHADATTAAELWSDRDQVPGAYRTALRYSLRTVTDFVRDYRGPGLVVVLVGDHQPGTIVSGFGGNRDVPVTLIADEPAVLERIQGWGWEPGLRPSDDAPVWSMGDFRDRFLTAFSRSAGGP